MFDMACTGGLRAAGLKERPHPTSHEEYIYFFFTYNISIRERERERDRPSVSLGDL
jgi:hypothetical protein